MNDQSIKPGWKSTEFLLTSLAAIAGVLASQFSGSDMGRVAGLVVAALASVGYSWHRAGVKRVEVAGKVAAAERADVMAENARARRPISTGKDS